MITDQAAAGQGLAPEEGEEALTVEMTGIREADIREGAAKETVETDMREDLRLMMFAFCAERPAIGKITFLITGQKIAQRATERA